MDHQLSIYYHALYTVGAHPPYEVTRSVIADQGGGIVVITDHQICGISALHHAKLSIKIRFNEAVSSVERSDELWGPPGATLILMFEEADLQLFEHIASTAVGADYQLVNILNLTEVSDVVVHIAAGVVG